MKKEFTEQEREEAIEKIKAFFENNHVLRFSYEDGIDCEEELIILGVDTNAIERSLRQIDYYTCSIKYDDEYHLAEELQEEVKKIHGIMSEADLGIDYEINA